jgi:hypothetical protein
LAASPAALALGRSSGAGWRARAGFTLTNLSTRTVRITLGVRTQDEGAAAVDFELRPNRLRLAPGHSTLVHVGVLTASAPSGTATSDGAIVASIEGGGGIRVPWAIAFGPVQVSLIRRVVLSVRSFKPSDVRPALLGLDAGRVLMVAGRPEIRPLARLDVELWRGDGSRVGLLARLRDVLPGRFTFGLTGRDPGGQLLPAGDYVLRIVAYPVDSGPPSSTKLRFALR